MEPITHFLTGACLARSGFNRKTAYATLAMTLAAEAPDLDVLWGLRGPVAGFQHRRGITHTFLGALFVALAVTGAVWLFDRWRSRRPPIHLSTRPPVQLSTRPPIPARWILLWFFSLIAVFSHIFLDWTNNYGIRPFFPFNPRWYSLDIVFIVEPVILGCLLLGIAIPAILGLVDREIGSRRTLFRGRAWAVAALCLSALVTGVRWNEHQHALRLVANTQFGDEPALRTALEPYPVNPFHWFAIVEAAGYDQTGSVDTRTNEVDTSSQVDTFYKRPASPAVAAAKRSWLGQVYLGWARFPVVTDRGSANLTESGKLAPNPLDTAVEFRDLRFAYSALAPASGGGPDDATVLAAWVYLTPEGKVDAMAINGRLQKNAQK